MRNPDFVYKVVSRDVFDASDPAGTFAGMPIDLKDGYVHFSTARQLGETLRQHFAGQGDLVVFSVHSRDLGANLRWEPSRGGQLFPHLHGELPMSAVAQSATIAVAADGGVTLPDWVK